jgi:hypothetical protein
VEALVETRAQIRDPTLQPPAHRARRDSLAPGDVRSGDSIEVPGEQSGTEGLGNLSKRIEKKLLGFEALRRLSIGRGYVGLGSSALSVQSAQLTTSVLSSEIQDDASEPRPQSSIRRKWMPQRGEPGLLHDVLGGRPVADEMQCQTPDPT